MQKTAVALLSLAGAFADPRRADLIAACGETTGASALRGMQQRMLANETGRLLLQERPRVTVSRGRGGGGAGRGPELTSSSPPEEVAWGRSALREPSLPLQPCAHLLARPPTSLPLLALCAE